MDSEGKNKLAGKPGMIPALGNRSIHLQRECKVIIK